MPANKPITAPELEQIRALVGRMTWTERRLLLLWIQETLGQMPETRADRQAFDARVQQTLSAPAAQPVDARGTQQVPTTLPQGPAQGCAPDYAASPARLERAALLLGRRQPAGGRAAQLAEDQRQRVVLGLAEPPQDYPISHPNRRRSKCQRP